MENLMLYILKTNVLAAVCILTVFLLSHFVKGRYSSQWRYLMWLFIAISLLIPMNLFAETAVIELEVHHQELAADVSISGEKVDAVLLPDFIQTDSMPGQSLEKAEDADRGNVFSALSVSDVLLLVGYIWVAGVVILFICRAVSYRISLSEIKRWSVAVKDEDIRTRYLFICEEMGIKKPPKLVVNSSLQSPLLVGIINTRLYLPDVSYSEKELMLIFIHELSHYRNRDLWYKTFLMAVNTIYWFNPLIYLMVKEAEKDVEYICDSKVVAKCSHADCMLYNRLLLKTAASSNSIHYLSASLNDSTTAFKERILYMMKAKRMKRGVLPVLVLTITLLVSNAVVGCTLKVYATAENKKILEESDVPAKTVKKASDKAANKAPEIEAAKLSTSQKTDSTPQKPSPTTPAETVPTVTPKETAALENENIPVPTPESTPDPVIVQEVKANSPSAPVPDEEPADDPSVEDPDDSGQVSASVQLFEGGYYDNSIQGDDTVEKYYEVGITNITATSFDFTIYEVDAQSGGSEVVFLTNSALFTGDGTTAAYEGDDYTLSFSFPDNHGTYPIVTDMIISGFEPLEGKTLVNNGIPGCEFG